MTGSSASASKMATSNGREKAIESLIDMDPNGPVIRAVSISVSEAILERIDFALFSIILVRPSEPRFKNDTSKITERSKSCSFAIST